MNYRRKTAIILIVISLIMFSPIAHNVLTGFKNPFFQNLEFAQGTLAPWYAWILALLIAIGYVLYTFKAPPEDLWIPLGSENLDPNKKEYHFEFAHKYVG